MNQKEFQVINILIKNRKIGLLRKKFDPNYEKGFRNHLTLVYPFSGINQEKLEDHIKNAIRSIKPFKANFNEVWKFKNNPYIYLISKDSKNNFMKFYENLNRGLLKGFENKDMPRYIPHISIGKFGSDKEANAIMKSIKIPAKGFNVHVKSIQLLTLNEDNSIKLVKNFRLKPLSSNF